MSEDARLTISVVDIEPVQEIVGAAVHLLQQLRIHSASALTPGERSAFLRLEAALAEVTT